MFIKFVMVNILMRIIKRKKGQTQYFYLQHSYRKEGKITTRELYLGKKIPDNIEEIKARLMHEPHKALFGKLEKIKIDFQKEWEKTPPSAKNRELHEIALAFTYNTNAIEGSTITLAETRLILEDKIAPNKPLRDIRETESHAAVFFHMLNTQEEFSDQLLLKWHREIFKETKPDIAGKFRNYPVRVGSYLAPDWHNIKNLIEQLITFTNQSNLNSVELSARVHYIFEKIHPFGDGNGRIGRLLMNYILWKNGYPMLIIEYTKRKSYYNALERPEEGFVTYFIRRYLSVHKQRLQ
jgi:Fic family protein